MNMLVGVLCEIVSMVASVEREELTVTYVRDMLLEMLRTGGLDASVKVAAVRISRGAFQELLMMPPAVRIIQEIGVDVVGLVDFADYIFKDGSDLTFEEFMELVLQLRGTNNATVKDIVDLRRYVIAEILQIGAEMEGSFDGVRRILESLVLKSRHMPLTHMPHVGLNLQLPPSPPQPTCPGDVLEIRLDGPAVPSPGAASSDSCTALARIIVPEVTQEDRESREKCLRQHQRKMLHSGCDPRSADFYMSLIKTGTNST